MKNKPLMSKAKADENVRMMSCYTHAYKVDELPCDIFWGREMHTNVTNSTYNDKDTWRYMDKNVEAKIKDDYQYKVWYDYHDASDPMDSSCSHTVYYVEEISKKKSAMIAAAKEFLKNI